MQPLCACSQRSLCPSSQVSILTTSPLIKNFKASGYLEFQNSHFQNEAKAKPFFFAITPRLRRETIKISCFMKDVNVYK